MAPASYSNEWKTVSSFVMLSTFTIQHSARSRINTKEHVSDERPLPPGPPGEGGRRPGEGRPATLFTIPALTRAPLALCPLPEGEGARPKQSPKWPISGRVLKPAVNFTYRIGSRSNRLSLHSVNHGSLDHRAVVRSCLAPVSRSRISFVTKLNFWSPFD